MEKKVQIAVSAPSSNCGKTLAACGLLEVMKRRGLCPCAFKTGPDYIDPMFHRSVLNVSSHNLDLVMADEAYVRDCYRRELSEHGAAVIEGVMGLYDGLSGKTDCGSCWHLADTLDIPVLLVLSPQGSSLTTAAEVKGLLQFRADSRIAGIVLNQCRKSYASLMKEILEKETGIPVIGYLPELPDVRIKSRHLGLYQADEIEDLQQNIGKIADAMEETFNWKLLEERFSVSQPQTEDHAEPLSADTGREMQGSAADRVHGGRQDAEGSAAGFPRRERPVIALARDEAFSFCYQETQEVLDSLGAEIVYFSPVHEPCVPENADGLLLPGGYPELYAEELSENREMRDSIRSAAESGMPFIAECGGFLYLLESLQDGEGQAWPMAGVFPGRSRNAGKLVRFGYAEMRAETDGLLLRAGESMRVHEFHYWEADYSGSDFSLHKPLSERQWTEGYSGDTFYAGFPHLYLAAHPEAAERFVRAAGRYRSLRTNRKNK